MKSISFLLASLLIVTVSFSLRAAAPAQSELPVFPTPATVTIGSGFFTCSPSVRVTVKGVSGKDIKSEIENSLKQCPSYAVGGKKQIRLQLSPKAGLPAEGYTLNVTPDAVEVVASTPAGLLYGKQSLLQLIRSNGGKIPACTVTDAPRMAWRGFMLDEARHFFGKQKVFQLLDLMVDLKLNVFHWHLTDEPGWRIEIKRYPRLTSVGAVGVWDDATTPAQFYTQEEIKEVIEYAAKRNIMVVPEIDMPGHASAACRAYPEISAGGEGRWKDFTFNPAKEETYQFLSNVLTEVAGLFPSPYIHIGGDEVYYGNKVWFTDPQIQAFIREKQLGDELGLEHYFVRRMVDSIVSKGKIVIGWDELVDVGVTPDQAVIMWWRHDKPEQLQKAVDEGYTVICTPRRPFYLDYPECFSHKIGPQGKEINTFERAANFPSDTTSRRWQGRESQILGLQGSVWTERIADVKRLDFMTFPRLIAVAEAAWTPQQSKNTAALMRKLPLYLDYLDTLGIYYFDLFNPERTLEPIGPQKADLPEE